MTPERWRQVEELYHAALERSADARAALLSAVDPELRREVEVLLAQEMVTLHGDTGPAQVPVQVGQYRVEEKLGEGGMGQVYKARDTKLRRPVAIKFLSDELADAAARRRFQREAQTASSLNHPHILTVHDAGEIEGRQYLITEYIDGGTLKDWANREKRTWRQIIELLTGVADGLAAAHEARILHRDIKPANILITKSGYAKLADFGLAKLEEEASPADATRTLTERPTKPGVVIGTIAYMSPEQASGQKLDARSDIFSFGVVLYELLAGGRPFTGANDLEVLQKVIHEEPEPLGQEIPLGLRIAVEKALEKNPAERYQSMRDIVSALRRLAHESAETLPLQAQHPAHRVKWTRTAVTAGVAVLIALLLVAAGVLLLRPTQQPGVPGPQQYVQLTNLDSASQPALSPDGRMMAFVRGESTFMGAGQIYVKLLPDGDPVQLTHDDMLKMAPRFSPDGARIGYSTLGVSDWEIWTVPVLGGQEPRRLLANSEGLTWIEEADQTGATQPRVLFSEMTGKGITMAVVSSTESRSDQRTVFIREGVMEHFSYLSPDRQQLLLAEMGFNGWLPCRLAPFDGSSTGKSVGPAPAQCTSAAWSPDGEWMYFTANIGAGFHIWRQRYPDGTPEQVTFGPTEEEGIEFAPDGRSFLTSIGTRQSTLWLHDSRGDRQITSDAYAFQPSFSADGKKLYYLVRVGSGGTHIIHGSLWVMDLESGERQRLLPDYLMQHYSVSQDGQRVVFVAANDTGGRGVWLATVDGRSAPRRLTAGDGLQAFFGAGGEVFFAAQEKDGTFIYRVNPDGSYLRKAIPTPVYLLYGVPPDGKNVAAWVTGSNQETKDAVLVYPLDGGAPTMICRTCGGRDSEFPQFLSWSPDGKFLYISIWAQATYAVPLSPGRILPPLPSSGIESVEAAARLPGAKAFPVPGAFAGPNPSIYAFSKTTAQRNIYRVPVP